MKKLLAVLLSLVLVLSLFGPAAAALEEDTAPEETAEAAVAAVEEEPVLPETAEAVTDEEPAAEEPAAEEAAEEPAEAAEEAEEEAVPEEPAEAAEPEAEEPAEAPAEAEAEAELPEEDAPVEEAVPEEEVIPAEEVIPEEEAAIEEEPAAEEPEEEAEPAEPTKYVKFEKKLDNVAVTAVAEAGAFDVPVELQVKTLIPGSAAYKEADKALTEEGYEYDGMLALDIGFADENGAPVEPAGPVSVSLKLITDGDVPADAESAAVAHIADDGVQLVADTADEAEGTVTVDETAVSAEFVVDSFSTFVITWTEGEEEMKATVHWGELGADGSFTEFDAATLDTTAASISLRNAYSGYTYTGADYCAPGVDREDGVTILSDLYKTDDGTWEYVRPATEDSEEQRLPLENGSHIYAYYFVPGEPNPSSSSSTTDIPAPTTTKQVVANGDGTYTIILDVEGNTVQEDDSHYANVLIILDATRSMEMNGSQKWANAKSAVQTLINTLTTGENEGNSGKIDFCLVTFGRAATLRDWTKDESALNTTVNGLNTVTTSGTNWESGLRAGVAAIGTNTLPDNDPLYVIFLTDGDPNTYYTNTNSTNYDNSGTANGYQNSSTTSANRAYDEARTLAAAGKLYGIFCFDGTTIDTTSDSYTRLNGVITGTGQGGQKTIGATADTIEQEFKDIAETILKDLGANNVQVDDGVPSLSNVSAAVAGEASGFEYQIKREGDEDYSAWAEAPGASYSNDNGVTWDLAELGTVQPGASYRLKFTVWPSQEAYDLIADLNNGIKTMTDAELEEAGIAKSEDGVYTLKTNTHLKTTYTVGDTTYTDEPDKLAQAAMLLPTETIKVEKKWYNKLDGHDGTVVKLEVTKDGDPYLYDENALEVSEATGWKSEDIFISMGQIKGTGSSYEVLETGHDYEVVEPPEFTWRWELTSEVYHPMVINGVPTVLIKDDNASGTEGTDYYVIEGTKYAVGDGENVLTAVNNRRSWLQLEKTVTGENAPEDALFEFKITVTDPKGEDVWFSVYDPDAETNPVKDLDVTGATAEEGNTGYFYAASGGEITVKMEAGWTLRFTNLRSDTTYTIEETTLPDGFKFTKAEGDATSNATEEAGQDDPETATVSGMTASGTINVPNAEFYVTYTNEYAETEIEVTKIWEDNDDQIGERPTAEEFKESISLLVNGEISTDYDDNLTITDNEDGTYTIKYSELPAYIDNEDAEYQVQETTVPEGYTASTEEPVDDGDEITNTLKTGNLTISKTVESDLAADKETKFTFTITTDPTVNGTFEATGAYEEVEFEDGEATVELADGETVTIKGLAAGVEYTVTETEVEGFETESEGDTGEIPEDEAAEAEFTNTRETGDLTVTKELESDLAADADKTFTITVTLSDDSISGTYGDMTFDGGVATVELKGGESATAEGLPTTVEYTVEEDDESAEGFDVDYDGEEGEITTDGAEATVTNARVTGGLKVAKELDSDLAADADKTFTITVTLSDNSISGTYGDMTFDGGVATVELKGGESATAEGLPTTVEYTVEEDDESAEGFEVDYDNEEGEIGENLVTATVTNTRETGDLTVTKEVESDLAADADKTFTITVTLSDDSISGTYGDMEFTDGVATVELKGGESATAEGLPTTVEYTVEEDDESAEGFEVEYDGEEGEITTEGAEATVTNTRETGDLTVTKEVESDLAADADKTFTITVTLSDTSISGTYGDMEFTDGVATVELKGGESATAEGLPTTVEYTVEEDEESAEGFEVEYDGEEGEITTEGAEATVTNTRETGDLTVTKTVESDLDEDADVVFTFTVTLDDTTISGTYGDMEFDGGVAKVELKDGESATAEGLPTTVGYTVEEAANDAYETESEGDEGEITTEGAEAEFTNTRKMIEITITKVWDDQENKYGVRPDEVTVELYAGDTVYDDETLADATTWEEKTATFTVPEYTTDGEPIEYSADEQQVTAGYVKTVDGDADSGFTITNAFEPLFVDPPVGKTVEGNPRRDETFVFKMTGSAETDPELDEVPMPEGAEGNEMTMEIVGSGKEEFGEFPLVVPGTYTYVITEEPGSTEGYNEGYAYSEEVYTIVFEVTADEETNALALKTTINGEEVTDPTADDVMFTNIFEEPTVDVSGTKTWDDADDQDGKRPDSITINLLADGEKVDSVTVTEDDDWKFEFIGVPKYNDDFEEIEYTVTEETVDGYETEITDFDVTNTHEPEKVDVSVAKVWEDNDDQDGKRPDSITVTLSNGDTVTLSEDNDWTATITGLPKYEKGEEIEYTWTEASVDGYELTDTKVEEYLTTLTNTHEPEVTKVDVTKVWTDADDKDGIRPDSVTINLLADGKETGASVTLNEGNSWKGSFINLPKYADGKEIEYTISEVTVEGYTTTISGSASSGFTVTNVHVPEDTPPTGDNNMLGLWVAMLSVSALGIGAVLRPRKRRNGAD